VSASTGVRAQEPQRLWLPIEHHLQFAQLQQRHGIGGAPLGGTEQRDQPLAKGRHIGAAGTAISCAPMSFARSVSRRSLAWIAFAAILFNALAPLAAQILSPEAAASFTELCTARGIERIAGDGGAPENTGAMQHCPFCVSQHALFIPASGTLPLLAQLDGAHAQRPPFLHVPRPTPIRAIAEPRAPPSVV
jgi:hypothetical protein